MKKAEQNKTKGKTVWTMTTLGFFSVVIKGKPGEYQIRARQRGDLENLIRAADLRGQKIIATDNSDYAFRIVVLRDELDRVFEALENSITYDNVKSAVGRTPGQEQHASLYHSVWSILGRLQAGGPYGQKTGGHQPQRSLLASERDERTLGDSPAKRTIHATDSHGAHNALDDVEPPPRREHKLPDDEGAQREERVAPLADEVAAERAETQSQSAAQVGRRVNNLKRWNEWHRSGSTLTYEAWREQARGVRALRGPGE